MKVLVVEDSHAFAKGFSEVLAQAGHTTTCVVGFANLESLEAVSLDGTVLTLDPADFDLALVDGQLEQIIKGAAQINGPEVVARLVQAKLVCFGISTEAKLNARMVELGAVNGANKALVFVAMVAGVISVEEIVAADQPAMERLAACQSKFGSDEFKQWRQRADAIVQKYL